MPLINCPSCRRELQLPEDLLGHLVKCPACGQTFTGNENEEIPEAASAEEESPPESSPAQPARTRAPENEREPVEDRPSRPQPSERPARVQAIAIMMLIGGIYALVHSLGLVVGTFGLGCLWPGVYYAIVFGILAIVKGSALVGEQGLSQPPPTGIAIMQIIDIINGDVVNCVMGIIALIFLNEPEVRRWYRG